MSQDSNVSKVYLNDNRKKAVKMVIVHVKKKIAKEFVGSEYVKQWVAQMDELLSKPEFNISDYISMRKKLNDVIESTVDEEVRYKLRDSWYSFGKVLDKRAISK